MERKSDYSQKKLFQEINELAQKRMELGMNLMAEQDSKEAEATANKIRKKRPGIYIKQFRYLMLRENLSISQVEKMFPLDIIRDKNGNIKINDFNCGKIRLQTFKEFTQKALNDESFYRYLYQRGKATLVNKFNDNPGITTCKNILKIWIKYKKQLINSYPQKLESQRANYTPSSKRQDEYQARKLKAKKLKAEGKEVEGIADLLDVSERTVYNYLK